MAAASCDLLDVFPPKMQFPFERNQQSSCSLRLTNRTIHTVAFKFKTTCTSRYAVRPNIGVISPRSSCTVIVTMRAPRVPYLELQIRDKLLVQCMVISESLPAKDITSQMFMKEKGKTIGEVKLKVYVLPPEQLSEIAEGRVGSVLLVPATLRIMATGSSTSDMSRGSVSLRSADEPEAVVGIPVGQIIQLPQLAALELTEEKDSALEQNRKLLYELELLRREVRRWVLLVVGLLAIILGYLIKK